MPSEAPPAEPLIKEDMANMSDQERFERSMKRLEQSIIERERARMRGARMHDEI
jgi:hypothetical protein